MQRHVREIKKEVEQLVASGEIEDFRFDQGGKRHIISFRYRGSWHSIPFAQAPRTPFGDNFVRQQIRRKIKGIDKSGYESVKSDH